MIQERSVNKTDSTYVISKQGREEKKKIECVPLAGVHKKDQAERLVGI